MSKKIVFLVIILNMITVPFSCALESEKCLYRRQIIFKNVKMTIPENFTINITLNTKDLIDNKKINPDCSDIKIIDPNGNEIDRLVEQCNDTNSTIYFMLNNFSPEKRYYLCYGNLTSEKPKDDKTKIYYFYDDFENYNVGIKPPFGVWSSNGGLWKIDNSNSFSGNKSVFENGLASGWVTLNNTINVENFTYISYGMIGTQSDVWSFGVSFVIQNSTGYRYQAHWEYQIGSGIGGWTFQLRKVFANMEHYTLGAVYPYNHSLYNLTPPELYKWYEFKIIRSYPNIKVYINNSLIFDVNDSTFKSGSIGFSRYSNLPDSSRKSWYDDVIVMLYMDPWPEVYLGEEEQYIPTSLIIQAPKEIKVDEKQEISFSLFQNFTPVRNLTLDDINISIQDTSVQKLNLKNHNNGSYSLEIKATTRFLGNKKIILQTPITSNSSSSFITVEPKENSIIITNNDWKNYIPAISTGKKVLITNSSNLIDFYKPEQIFLLDIQIPLEKEHYYIDRDTLYLMFFKSKDIIIAKNKEAAIASSMLKMPIITEETEMLQLLNPKNIYNFSTIAQVQNYYFTHPFRTNYLILVNENSEKSMFAAPLAFKHNGFIIFSSDNPDEAKQSLKQAISKLKYRLPESYKFHNKIFLALIDVPHFSITDPVDDGLIDYDGDYIKTDNIYADINDDGYLDLSIARLEGSDEAITHQICAEASGKKALVISVYDTPRILDLIYGIPLMRYSAAIHARLSYFGFDAARLVEQRSSQTEYSSQDIKSLANAIRDSIENEELTNLFHQMRFLISTFNEATYLLVEFDWDSVLTKLLNREDFVLYHLPIYNEDNLIANAANKDVIVYGAFGNSTHWFTPDGSAIAISSLPHMPSFVYLYYSKSSQSLQELQERGTISVLATTSSAYTPQSSYTSYLFFEKFNGEIGYVTRNAKNSIFSYYKAIKNSSFYDPQPYLKEYYSRTLYSDPAKIFDPYPEFLQSEDVFFEGHLKLRSEINPKYKIISNGTHNFAFFYGADFMDDIPLYRRTFLLPEDAEVIDVKFYPEFREENVYSQVNASFWYTSYKLLDNRTVVDVVAIPLTTSGQVLSKLIIEVIYNAGIEITAIKAREANLEFSVYSNADREANATVLVEKDGESYYINTSIHLNPGINSYNIILPTNGYGKYSIALIIEADKIAGPKYTFFELKPLLLKITFPLKRMKLDFTNFFLSKKSFSESISISHEANKRIIDYKTADASMHAELGEELTAVLMMRGKRLEVRETAEERSYTLKTPDGQATFYSSKGMTKQTYTRPELLEELRSMMSTYNEMMLRIQDRMKEA